MVVIAFLTDFFGTLLTGLGLRSTDPNKKYKYYRVAIYSLGIAILALFLALIIYPTSMTKDMEAGKLAVCLQVFFFSNFLYHHTYSIQNTFLGFFLVKYMKLFREIVFTE